MIRHILLALAAHAALLAPALGAQTIDTAAPSPAPSAAPESTDTVFLQAQRMAAEGQGDAARALVQKELDAAPVGSPRYAEALYWRAVVAGTAADAERDLRQIIVEYPLAPRAEDALLRLAQLEMTRGDNDQALQHLQRLVLEHPDSPSRSRASFWMGRVLFEQNKPSEACRRLADAARTTPAAEVEQKNQIDFWMQRCQGVDTSVVAGRDSGTAGLGTRSATNAGRAQPSAEQRVPSSGLQYTVQVAAYGTRAAAEEMRKSLARHGYDARVAGTTKPFRVRIGRYTARAEADSVVAKLKAQKITGFVTEAEPR